MVQDGQRVILEVVPWWHPLQGKPVLLLLMLLLLLKGEDAWKAGGFVGTESRVRVLRGPKMDPAKKGNRNYRNLFSEGKRDSNKYRILRSRWEKI